MGTGIWSASVPWPGMGTGTCAIKSMRYGRYRAVWVSKSAAALATLLKCLIRVFFLFIAYSEFG